MPRLPTHPHVLVMRTLSKFGLAGVRLGYLSGAAPLIDADRQGAPALQHQRAERRGDAVRARARRRVRARRRRCCARSAHGCRRRFAALPGVRAYPERGQHDPGAGAGRAAGLRGMKRRGVLVKNVAGLHPLLADCLRMTVGTPEENARAARRAPREPEPAVRLDAHHDRTPHRHDPAQHQGDADPRPASTSTAPAPRSSRPASASSTTCSTRSRATA